MLDDLLIGGMAGVISRTATAPLELYKIQRQNQYLKEASIKTVLKKEGIRYLWKGNMTNCLRVFPQIATNFTAFENCKKHIFNNIEDEKLKNFYSGGVAGVFSMATIYPLETMSIRLGSILISTKNLPLKSSVLLSSRLEMLNFKSSLKKSEVVPSHKAASIEVIFLLNFKM